MPQYTDKSSLPGPSGVMEKQLIKFGCRKQPALGSPGTSHTQAPGHRGWSTPVCRCQAQALPYFSLVWDYSSFNTIRFLGLRLFPKLLCISVLPCAHIKSQPKEGFGLDKNIFAFGTLYFFHSPGLLKRYFSFPLLTVNDLREEGVAIFN